MRKSEVLLFTKQKELLPVLEKEISKSELVPWHWPVISGTDTIEEAQGVLLNCHVAQLVLQTYSMNIDSLMTQEHSL